MSKPNNYFNGYRVLAYAYFNNKCSLCKEKEKKLRIHHIDGDCSNNLLKNLSLLCSGCHSKEHRKIRDKLKVKKIVCEYCNYVWEHKGNNPFVTCPSCLKKTENNKINTMEENEDAN